MQESDLGADIWVGVWGRCNLAPNFEFRENDVGTDQGIEFMRGATPQPRGSGIEIESLGDRIPGCTEPRGGGGVCGWGVQPNRLFYACFFPCLNLGFCDALRGHFQYAESRRLL